jgi:DNA-binding response OmpR family regulator
MLQGLGRLLIVDDDRSFADTLKIDGERLGLAAQTLNEPYGFKQSMTRWQPTIIAMDLVMPDADGLELLRQCGQPKFPGHLILMSGGFELYLRMAEEIAQTSGLRVAAKLPKPFRPKQFAYLLMSLI